MCRNKVTNQRTVPYLLVSNQSTLPKVPFKSSFSPHLAEQVYIARALMQLGSVHPRAPHLLVDDCKFHKAKLTGS